MTPRAGLPAGRRLENAVVFFAGTLYAGKMTIDALKYHRQYGGTACPGAKLVSNWTWFRGLVEAKLAEIAAGEGPGPEPDPPDAETRLGLCEAALKELAPKVGQLEALCAAYRLEIDTHSGRLVDAEEWIARHEPDGK